MAGASVLAIWHRLAMQFLDRLLGKRERVTRVKTEALTLHAAGTVHVVGESYRQATLEQVALFATTTAEPYLADLEGNARALARKNEKRWFQAVLLREFDNPHDKNAVAVHAAGHGLVGYLDRQTAIDYAPVFDELARQGVKAGACPAKLTGGDDVSWGVILALSSPEAVVADLRAPAD
jgi:HIRAN domain